MLSSPAAVIISITTLHCLVHLPLLAVCTVLLTSSLFFKHYGTSFSSHSTVLYLIQHPLCIFHSDLSSIHNISHHISIPTFHAVHLHNILPFFGHQLCYLKPLSPFLSGIHCLQELLARFFSATQSPVFAISIWMVIFDTILYIPTITVQNSWMYIFSRYAHQFQYK